MNERMREILANIEDKRTKARAFLSQNKKVEAKALMDEIKELRNEYEIEAALYEDEKKNVLDSGKKKSPEVKVDLTVAFNKAVLGKNLTEAEAALVEKTEEDGGYLVPKEQQTTIKELKRDLVSLKEFCNVIEVGSNSGSMPLEVDASDKLISFDEYTDINNSDIKFGQVAFKTADYGDIIPISNSLLQDEKANLTSYVGKRFAKKAVRTENEKIIEIMKAFDTVDGASSDDITDAIVDLDPAIQANTRIFTNQEGFKYLKNLKDKNGNPLLSDSLADPTKKALDGYTIEVLSDVELPSKEKGTKKDFYVGDMYEAIAFFDRNVYEMAVDKSAGFTKNATIMRVIERFDVKKVDKAAMKLVQITPAEK